MLQESEFIKNLPQHLKRDYWKQCLFFLPEEEGSEMKTGSWQMILSFAEQSK